MQCPSPKSKLKSHKFISSNHKSSTMAKSSTEEQIASLLWKTVKSNWDRGNDWKEKSTR